jgi:outer membrane autotransporter protein
VERCRLLTASVGDSYGQASTMYGTDNFNTLLAGVASKTGYNFEFKEGKYILQPSIFLSYTFANTFDYTTASGVNVTSDLLNAIQVAPGVKFIYNAKNGWQPYLAANMVFNIMDDQKFRSNDVALPEMSIDPYFEYGVGVQRRWGERFTGFGQCMLRGGGRNGVALMFDFRIALGK